jgi:Ca2+-transporting ATPase
MMKGIARVRRDGQAVEVDAEELVPGDVVLMEAGNRVPADGRICVAATLEIERRPSPGVPAGAKGTGPVPGDDMPLGLAPTRGQGPVTVASGGMEGRWGASGSTLRSVGCAR